MVEENKDQNIDTGAVNDEPVETGQDGERTEEAATDEQDIEAVRREADEARDQLLRLAAEFENYKKRMEREREGLLKYAGEQVLRELLTTLDNLDRAIEQGTAESDDAAAKLEAMLEGVDLTRKGLLATLEKFEVVPIDSVGREFDPNEHEAMSMEAETGLPPNHVVREFARGYRFKDRLLRPARVVVSEG